MRSDQASRELYPLPDARVQIRIVEEDGAETPQLLGAAPTLYLVVVQLR